MATSEDVKGLSYKAQGVDSRVSRLEGCYQHLATNADMRDIRNRLFVRPGLLAWDCCLGLLRLGLLRLGLLIIVVGEAVAIVQRL